VYILGTAYTNSHPYLKFHKIRHKQSFIHIIRLRNLKGYLTYWKLPCVSRS